MKIHSYKKYLSSEDSRKAAMERTRTCKRILSDLKHHMIHDLCWADQENDLIEKLLKQMMEINSLLRNSLKERTRESNNAAEIFISPKKLSTTISE